MIAFCLWQSKKTRKKQETHWRRAHQNVNPNPLTDAYKRRYDFCQNWTTRRLIMTSSCQLKGQKYWDRKFVLATQFSFYAYKWSFNNGCKCKQNIIYTQSGSVLGLSHTLTLIVWIITLITRVMLLYSGSVIHTLVTLFSITPLLQWLAAFVTLQSHEGRSFRSEWDCWMFLLIDDINLKTHNIFTWKKST